MNKSIIRNKICYLLAGAAASVMMLSACSSDEVEAILKDETVKVSGTITGSSGGLGGVTVKGIYSDNDPLNPQTTTAPDGTFSLTVLKNIAVSLQASASNYVTLNSAKEALGADESGLDIELPTTADGDALINALFPTQSLVGMAWLAVNVVDSNDVEVPGITITSGSANEVYTDCAGADSGDTKTVVDVTPCNRDAPMYFAYFDTESSEVNVSDGTSTQVAPVRRGQVTFLEFVQ